MEESKPHFGGLIVKYCEERKIDPDTLKCKTRFSDVRALVKWPSLIDVIDDIDENKDVPKPRLLKRALKDIIPEDVIDSMNNDRNELCSLLDSQYKEYEKSTKASKRKSVVCCCSDLFCFEFLVMILIMIFVQSIKSKF